MRNKSVLSVFSESESGIIIPDPDPGKTFRSMWIWINNTGCNYMDPQIFLQIRRFSYFEIERWIVVGRRGEGVQIDFNLLSHVSVLRSPLSCLLSHVFNHTCLTSPVSCLSSPVSGITSPVSCLLSHISCLTSLELHLLYHFSCKTSPVSHLLSPVSRLLYPVSRLLSYFSCLTYPVLCLTFPVSGAQHCVQLCLIVWPQSSWENSWVF